MTDDDIAGLHADLKKHVDTRTGLAKITGSYVAPEQLIATIERERGGDTRVVLTTVSVELAQQLLDRYTPARRALSERHVASIAYLLQRLQQPDEEGHVLEEISVGPDGKTLAGQHLLHAVVRTGIPVAVWVILNREPPAFVEDELLS